MIEADVVDILEAGSALIVGLVADDGAPVAGRGWGLTFADGAARARLLLGEATLAALGTSDQVGAPIAVTGCNVLTLRSAQVKGPITAVAPADDADLVRLRRYCDAFFDDVGQVDSIPREMMERLVPSAVVACDIDVIEVFDQTPGPTAGSTVVDGAW